MTNVSVLDQIKKLVELQKIDGEIYTFNKDLREKPAILEGLKNQFETKKQTLSELEDRHKRLVVSRKELELDLQSKDDDIAKANVSLSQIKTNKEYSAKIKEIEGINADKSIIEEKILLSYDEADGIKAEADKEKENLANEEKTYLVKKKEIEESIGNLEDRINVLGGQRNQLIPNIDKTTLDRYDKILVNKEGLAIVPVLGDVCGGCYMNVPAQIVNVIKMHEELVYCEFCARILYLEEDL